jgi:serine/threonine protein kinase
LQVLTPVIPKAIEEEMISGSLQDSLNVCLQFQILCEEILCSGHFGIVYGGVHRTKGRNIAIKVIDKLRFPSIKEAQFKNEVSIFQNIDHPGVIRLEKMFESPERHTHSHGETERRYVRYDNPQPYRSTFRAFDQIFDSINSCSSKLSAFAKYLSLRF